MLFALAFEELTRSGDSEQVRALSYASSGLAQGELLLDANRYGEDDLIAAIDAGAEDVSQDDDVWEVVTEPADFSAVRDALEGLELQSAELIMRPKTTTPVEESQVGSLMRLIEELEDHDDVQGVHANFDVDADVLERVAAA